MMFQFICKWPNYICNLQKKKVQDRLKAQTWNGIPVLITITVQGYLTFKDLVGKAPGFSARGKQPARRACLLCARIWAGSSGSKAYNDAGEFEGAHHRSA